MMKRWNTANIRGWGAINMTRPAAARMEFDPCGHYARPDVLELEEGRLDGGEIVVRLSSVAAGDTSVRLRYSARGTAAGDVHNAPAGEYTFHVSRVGTIFNTGTGMTFTGHILLCVLLMLLVLATMAVTVASFIEYWRKAEFSYPMIGSVSDVAMMNVATSEYRPYRIYSLLSWFTSASYIILPGCGVRSSLQGESLLNSFQSSSLLFVCTCRASIRRK